MDLLDEWAASLDLTIGPLFAMLVRMDTRAPFDALELLLTQSFERIPGMTPDDVRVFAQNGFSLEQYGFVIERDADPDLTTDERPICHVQKGDCHIIAPNLAGFLSVPPLPARTRSSAIDRTASTPRFAPSA